MFELDDLVQFIEQLPLLFVNSMSHCNYICFFFCMNIKIYSNKKPCYTILLHNFLNLNRKKECWVRKQSKLRRGLHVREWNQTRSPSSNGGDPVTDCVIKERNELVRRLWDFSMPSSIAFSPQDVYWCLEDISNNEQGWTCERWIWGDGEDFTEVSCVVMEEELAE